MKAELCFSAKMLKKREEKREELKTDVLIVGAGFAGAATAFHLSELFSGSILVVESEHQPGLHASGLNSSMVIQAAQSKPVRQLFAASQSFYQQHAGATGFNQTGSLMLGSSAVLEELQDPELFDSEIRSPAQTRRQIPLLEGHSFEGALWTPSDGVMNIRRLLHYYIETASRRGATFRYDLGVRQIRCGRRFEVSTTGGPISAGRVINAAGAWSGKVGQAAGASEIPLRSFKRHLFVLKSQVRVDPDSPPVWNLEKDFYFRPRLDGVLFCVCDAELSDRLEPDLDPEVQQYMAEVLWKELPAFQDAERKQAWCCFRTFVSDGLPLIGPDPSLPGFFWVSGLAGYGMSASWEIGRLAALSISGGDRVPSEFDPARFL